VSSISTGCFVSGPQRLPGGLPRGGPRPCQRVWGGDPRYPVYRVHKDIIQRAGITLFGKATHKYN